MAQKKNIYQRMAAVMGDVTYIQKQKGGGLQYSVVTHDAVTARCRNALLKHGVIAYPYNIDTVWEGNLVNIEMITRFQNIDDPADFMDVHSLGQGIDKGDKAAGKATSYAFKYGLLKGLLLETGEDADLDQDVEYQPSTQAHELAVTNFEEAIKKATNNDEIDAIVKEHAPRLLKAEQIIGARVAAAKALTSKRRAELKKGNA